MALKIWLPLNGDIHNQGLIDATPTVGGTSVAVNNSGKIGKCYSFGTASGYIDIPVTDIKKISGSCTVAFWLNIRSFNTAWATVFSANKNSASWAEEILTFQRDNNTSAYTFHISNGTSNTSNVCKTGTLSTGVWNHFVLIADAELAQMRIYQNGELITTYNTSIVPNLGSILNFRIGVSSTGYQADMLLNDFRLYDEVLPVKVIKEISKGLVLHYPLNNGGFGQENLATNTAFPNSNVQGYCGQKAVLYNHSDWTSGGRFFVDDSNSRLTFTEIQANQPYTISAWVYIYDDVVVSHPNGTSIFYRIYKTGTSPTYPYDIAVTLDNITERNKWIKISNTFISPYTYTYNQGGSFSIGGYNGHFLVSMPKVELGSIATPWCPNSSDALADKLGLNNGIEYDVSGYQNNGSIIGALTCSSDTPRYMVSTYFNGGDNAITVPFNSVISDATIPFTINLWFKKSELGTDNYESLFGGPSGFEMDTRSGNATSLSLYMLSTRGGAVYSPFNLNEWYMVTMASDRTNEYYYVNGELSKTITAKSMPVGNYFIGAWQVYNKQNYKGLISDFRIYSTCLSADDILALYHTPVSIANNGTLMTQGELSEA